jgi:hypothetical protein
LRAEAREASLKPAKKTKAKKNNFAVAKNAPARTLALA